MNQGGGGVHTRQGNSEFVSLETRNADYASEKKKSLRVRYMYGSIFLMTNLIAWFLRDYGQRIVPQLHYLKSCGAGGQDCFHALGVLRVSLGCFIFFFLMFLSTSRTRKLHEPRNVWHSSWWSLKFIVFIVSMLAPFFFPPALIQLYGEFARAGAGIFLILQLVSVIQFISWWNKYWMPDEKMKQSCSLGLFTSTIFYIASFCGIGLMYSLYVPKVRCVLNIFFISWTLILLIVMMVVSLHSKVNRGLLSSGIMASYLVFLCWSAIRSEPATEKCSARKEESGNSDWITILVRIYSFFLNFVVSFDHTLRDTLLFYLSFLIAICAVVMATFSTGIDSQSFQFRKDEVKEEDDIPYKYGFFHLTFSLGAMYFAMLFISWNLNNSATKWSMDVGWTSTWVKIINEWFAATIYLWTLMSPVVRKAKVRDHEEGGVVQEPNDSAVP